MKPIMLRMPDDLLARLDAIADRHHLDRSEVIRRFCAAGLDANPELTDTEIRAARARRTGTVQRGAGLVIPLPPLARVDETAGAEPSTSGRRSPRAADRAALRLVAA
jgi:predicted transcriptional regulator